MDRFDKNLLQNPMDLAQDIGFTEEEVRALCDRFEVSFERAAWRRGISVGVPAAFSDFFPLPLRPEYAGPLSARPLWRRHV